MVIAARRSTVGSVVALLVLGLFVGLAGPTPARAQALAPASGTFRSVTPARLLDTRTHNGGSRVAARGTLHLLAAGRGGLPASNVTAVMLSVVVTGAASAGYVTAYADGSVRPGTSNVNFRAAVTVSNQVTVRVGSNGRVALYNGSSGAVDLVADVYGYFAGSPAGSGSFVTTSPARLLDTRSSSGASGTPGAHGTVNVAVAGRGGVPTSGVGAVALSITAVSPATTGSVAAYPAGGTAPPSPTTSFFSRVTTAGATVVPVGAGGAVTLVNDSAGPAPLVVDVVGYFVSGSAGPTGMFVPVPPASLSLYPATIAGKSGQNAVLPDRGFGRDNPHLAFLVAVTVVAKSSGYLTPARSSLDVHAPGTSALSLGAGSTTSGLLVTRPDADVSDSTAVWNGSSASVVLRMTLLGYFVSAPGAGAVAGRVTDAATGTGLGGVDVRVYDQDPDKAGELMEIFGDATTDADGRYVVAGVGAGDYMVCFTAENATGGTAHAVYDRQCWQHVPYFSESRTVVHVALGATTSGIDAALTSTLGGSISGVITGAGGTPLAGVRVASDDGVVVTSGADGTYHLDRVRPGARTVELTPGSVTGAGAPYGYLPATTDAVTVTAGADTSGVDVQLKAESQIVGHVRTSTGAPPPAGYVKVFGAGGQTYDGDIDVANGQYTVTGFAGGTYTVCFYVTDPAPGSPPYGWANQCDNDVAWPVFDQAPPGATQVPVGPGEQRTIDATIKPAGSISGTVRATAGGAAVDNVEVVVYDPATRERLRGANTDSGGKYVIQPGLPASTTGYTVCANGTTANRKSVCWNDVPDPGPGLPSGTTPVTVNSGALHTGIDFVLPPA